MLGPTITLETRLVILAASPLALLRCGHDINLPHLFSKYPSYPLATVAFQKVSFAYDILSKPSSRRMYDLHGITPDDPTSSGGSSSDGSAGINHNFSHPSYTARADETLSGVLLGVFCDFMQGDFQMLRTFLRECSIFILFYFFSIFQIRTSARTARLFSCLSFCSPFLFLFLK